MTVLQSELVLTGSDKTGGMWAGVIKHAQELKRTLDGMKDMQVGSAGMREAERLTHEQTAALRVQNSAWAQINRTIALGNRELQERITFMSRLHERLKGVTSTAGFVAGPALLRGTEKAIHGGADIQSEKVRLAAASMGQEQIGKVVDQAVDLHARFPNVGIASIMERYKELRSVLLHPEEAEHLLPMVTQAQAAMKAIDRTGQLGEGLVYAVKAAEILGYAQDPEKFKNY